MKYHVKTYGCQMNERDSECIGVLLAEYGHERAENESDADVVIVNTCSVREKAEAKALGKLGLLVSGARDGGKKIVGASGCMVQRLRHEIFMKVPGLGFAVGPRNIHELPRVLERVRSGARSVLAVTDDDEPPTALSGHEPGSPTAFVNILFGCNFRCAFCIVPAVRGREWSRPAADVVSEVSALAAAGTREVTLLGQSVMSYGRRNPVWPDDAISPRGFTEPLPRLLEILNDLEGLERIRFTSGHPVGCTEELTRAMASLPAVCDHLHLPVQSGSDRVLRLMRRGYTVDVYRRAVAELRKAVPSVAVTTDVIVGFPSETEEEFEQTRAFMDEIGFDNAFVFKYSPRSGTAAEEWDDDVPAEEKLRRNRVLLADQDERASRANAGIEGSIVSVLAEGQSARNPSTWSGRTTTNKIVVFEPPERIQAGELLSVEIDRTTSQALYGKVCDRESHEQSVVNDVDRGDRPRDPVRTVPACSEQGA